MIKHQTREQYLEAAVELMRPVFKRAEYEIPKVRVSCGWPSTGALSDKRARLGECWSKASADDSIAQIFISPRLESATEKQGVLSVLVHEVVHAVVGHEAKHGKVFKKCALAVGLVGKMTSTESGPELMELSGEWSKALGDYPHASLHKLKAPTKKQTTRMVKCECGKCGYVARTTKKWLEDVGAPICPCNNKSMTFEMPETEDEENNEDNE